MNFKTVFNPFSKFSERTLLIAGLIIFIAGVFIATYCGVVFDGVLDVHVSQYSFMQNALILLINTVSVFIPLFLLGKIINKRTRAIDILNTSLVSRLPLHVLGLFTNNSSMDTVNEKIIKSIDQPQNIDFTVTEMAILSGFTIAGLLLLTYFIILLVNGFRTATNTKKWYHFLLFAVTVIIAEIISKSLVYHI